jgi:hypothetical protein
MSAGAAILSCGAVTGSVAASVEDFAAAVLHLGQMSKPLEKTAWQEGHCIAKEPPSETSKMKYLGQGIEADKPKPIAESQRILSGITLSRQPENILATVFE